MRSPFSKLLKRSAKPIKRSRIKKHARPASETTRIYGPPARRAFVKSLPCAACGVVGYSQNAHVAPASEKGTGYKAGFEWIAALCGAHPDEHMFSVDQGCHLLHDILPITFAERFPDFDAAKAARETEQA